MTQIPEPPNAESFVSQHLNDIGINAQAWLPGDDIDAMVDESMANRADCGVQPLSEKCPLCKLSWHGLPTAYCPGPYRKTEA